jgi:Mg2+/Co2+ transporter CorB
MEFVSGHENTITGIFLFMDNLVYIYSPLILIFLTNRTYHLIYLAIAMSILTILYIAFFFHIPESLKFSLTKKDFDKFSNDLEYICKMNKVEEEKVEEINEQY